MTNEITQQVDANEENDAPLTVEVPSEIRAGVRVAPSLTSCSPYSSCYSNLTFATAG